MVSMIFFFFWIGQDYLPLIILGRHPSPNVNGF